MLGSVCATKTAFCCLLYFSKISMLPCPQRHTEVGTFDDQCAIVVFAKSITIMVNGFLPDYNLHRTSAKS